MLLFEDRVISFNSQPASQPRELCPLRKYEQPTQDTCLLMVVGLGSICQQTQILQMLLCRCIIGFNSSPLLVAWSLACDLEVPPTNGELDYSIGLGASDSVQVLNLEL